MTHSKEVKYRELIDLALTLKGSMGNTYNRFYDYSFTNMLLLMAQGLEEPVATYKVWQANGRQVKKGQKASAIVRPSFRVEKDDKGNKEYELSGFNYAFCIFGYSQTDGEELPPVELPEWQLPVALNKLRIQQTDYTAQSGNTQGYSFDRKFAINPMAKYPVKTTLHELAHIVLGHTTDKETHNHRGLKEFQAETTAFLALKELEVSNQMDESTSRAYIQQWLDGQTPEDKDIKAVFKAVDEIVKAGKPERVNA